MATLNAVILPAKALKGGRHKVRISIAHNSETRYIATDIVIENAKEFKNGQIVKRPDASYLNTKLRTLMTKIQYAIDKIEYLNTLSCSEIISIINSMDRVTTLQQLIDDFLNHHKCNLNTRHPIMQSYNTLLKVIPGSTLLTRIKKQDIIDVRNYLIDRKFTNNTINLKLSKIYQLFNFAKESEYIKSDNEFWNIGKEISTPRNSWIDADKIKLIRDTMFKSSKTNQAKDIFMLSFYLGGMNLIDILKIGNLTNRRLKYTRTKTERLATWVTFDIPNEAMDILSKLPDFELLKMNHLNQRFHYQMIKIRNQLDLGDDFVFYSARKSFAQIAFNLGISTGVIDYILGHKPRGSSNCLYSYISVTPQMATDAIRKVLDFIK